MDILSCLSDPGCWQLYFNYKMESGRLMPWEASELCAFIESAGYLPVAEGIVRGDRFPPPRKSAISKQSSAKKRIVYTYPKGENYVLKLLTYLLLRKYDHLFSDNLYSFRAAHSAKTAITRLTQNPDIQRMWFYKADISDYFNSVPVENMLPILQQALQDEPALFRFLAGLLMNPLVNENGVLVKEKKGIMAGTPISTFLANLYLAELDRHFSRAGKIYARYSDDIILFSHSCEELEAEIAYVHRFLAEMGLTVNPCKEDRGAPGEPWVFLGFCCRKGEIDIAPASVEKLKGKMRRKTRALMRWRNRSGKQGEYAARAFIKAFNRKLFESSAEHDLTWARWYFPTITTAESLHVIDRYAQSCIRFLVTGKHTKAAYNCRYEDMKGMGYVTLVNRYYGQYHFSENSEETVD